MKFLLETFDNPDCVLINKKLLLINNFVIAQLCKSLSAYVELSPDEIAEVVGNYAQDKVNQQSEEEINVEVENLIKSLESYKGMGF